MTKGGLKIGFVVLARPTFDVPFATETAEKAWANVSATGATLVGSPELLFDAEAVTGAMNRLADAAVDLLLILQATFADATMTVELARAVDAPIALWSVPEPRTGGRLRLNSLCGINLAGHALGKAGTDYAYIHRAADDPEAAGEIRALAQAGSVRRRLRAARIGVVGPHPAGFDTCAYQAESLKALCGAAIEEMPIGTFLERAKAVPDADTDAPFARARADLSNLDEMDPVATRKSLKVYVALKNMAAEKGYDALAVRCWPEFFTDFGCAACGAMAMMNEDRTPCGCEADAYGALTTLILRWLADEPAFMTDLVDMDVSDDTGVFWHCGLAPMSFADREGPVRAALHSNRKMPLLNEFAFKPGRITIARISQSHNETRMILGGGDVLRRPMSFSGTSGVVRFDKPAKDVLDAIMAEGLEHHVSIVYGEHRPALRRLAAMLDLPVVELA